MRALMLLLALVPVAAHANDVVIPSVFHISKSENKNEVHFSVRLDSQCAFIDDEPVTAYWRDREISESATSPLLFLERRAYDLDDLTRESPQHARFVLRALPERAIDLQITRRPDGTCSAKAIAMVGGEPSRLKKVYAKLSGWSIDYVVIQAVRVRDGVMIEERVEP